MTLDLLLDFFGTGKETCMSDNLDDDASDFEAFMGSVLPECLETRYQIQDNDCRADNVVCIVLLKRTAKLKANLMLGHFSSTLNSI